MADNTRNVWWFYLNPEDKVADAPLERPVAPATLAADVRESTYSWIPFSSCDRDQLEARWASYQQAREELKGAQISAEENDKWKVAVTRRDSPHQLWQVDFAAMQLEPIYWRNNPYGAAGTNKNVLAVRRSRWMAMADKEDFGLGGAPVPPEWEAVLERHYDANRDWTDPNDAYSGGGGELVERILGMETPMSDFVLLLGRGLPSAATLQIKTQPLSMTSGLTAARFSPLGLGDHSMKLIRGYSSFYSAVTSGFQYAAKVNPLASDGGRSPFDRKAAPPTKSRYVIAVGGSLPSPLDEVPGPCGPPKHLLLAVHGIGQKLAGKLGYDFVSDVDGLRRQLIKATVDRGGSFSDVYVLPICWRTELDMATGFFPAFNSSAPPPTVPRTEETSHDEFESLMQAITLDSIPAVRGLASDVALDVLLYMSPRHYQRILNAVVQEINRVYALFCKLNGGCREATKVHLVGHSLGAALVSDAISLTVEPPVNDVCLSAELVQERIRQVKSRFDFDVDHFFCLGSPLALFLLLKHVKPISCTSSATELFDLASSVLGLGTETTAKPSESLYPKIVEDAKTDGLEVVPKLAFFGCRQMYNIFHPYDPVAYRLEPLIIPPQERTAFATPVLLPYGKKGITKFKMEVKEKMEKAKGDLRDAVKRSVQAMPEWFRKKLTTEEKPQVVESNTVLEQPAQTASIESVGVQLIRPFNRRGRIDFCLQESMLENAYLSSIGAHFWYWEDEDVAAFIASELVYN